MEDTQIQQPDSEIIDLGFEVNEDDVKRPLLKGGSYLGTIQYARRQPTAKAGIPQWNIGVRLDVEAPTVDGKTTKPGFTLVYRFLAEPTGGMTAAMIKERLQRLHFAAAGAGKVNSGAWVGKQVQVAVKLREPHTDEKTGESYDASNEISGVYPVRK